MGARWMAALVIGLALAAPAAAQDAPEQVVDAYLGHLSRGETRQAAAMMHPRALDSFRAYIARAGFPPGNPGPGDPGKLRTFPGDSLLAVMLNQFVGSTEAGGMLRTLRAVPVGHVARDDLAYVVYNAETRIGNRPVSHTGLVVLRRLGDAWKVDPGDGAAVLMGSGGPMQIMMAATLLSEMNGIAPGAGKL